MKKNYLLRINPSIEALAYKNTLSIFVNDRTIAFRGSDSAELYNRIKSVFSKPKRNLEIKKLDKKIFDLLPALIKADIILEVKPRKKIEIVNSGIIASALGKLISSNGTSFNLESNILICIPDTNDLSVQKKALKFLKPGWRLVTGFYRGTTVYITPLIANHNTNLLEMFFRFLSTEAGIGNLYLIEELSEKISTPQIKRPLDRAVAAWVAEDIYALLRNNVLETKTGRIYRGSFVRRDDISFVDAEIRISVSDTAQEKADALQKGFVGNGKTIARFDERKIGTEEYPIFAVHAEIARARMSYLEEKEGNDAWGTGITLSEARLAAFMEAIERYSSQSYSIKKYPLLNQDKLDGPILDHRQIITKGKLDSYNFRINDKERRRWHPINNHFTGKRHWASLELVRYPVLGNEAGYHALTPLTSSGVAAHFSFDAALRGACHELVERDAFLIAWLRKASLPLISHASLSARLKSRIEHLKEDGYEAIIADLTSDLAPTICVMLSNKHSDYHHSMGASSNDDVEHACWKALNEACLTINMPRKKPRNPQDVLKNLNGPGDHAELYADGTHDDLLDRFFGSNEIRNLSDIKKFPDNIISRIQKSGYEIYTADMTDEKIKKIAPSIHVIRAIVPGLVPIQFGPDWALSGSPRVQSLPELMGWKTQAADESDYERFPHPFP